MSSSPKDTKMDLQMYWHIDYWDIPLNGVAMYKSRPVYFVEVEPEAEELTIDDPEHEPPVAPPTYALHALTDAHYHELETRHEEFGRMVGWYTDHRPDMYGPWVDTEAGREWYDNEAARPLSFDPLRDCPMVATVPSYAFEWFFVPRL
jgi:hypothetical protein